jgi:hypothetical protein
MPSRTFRAFVTVGLISTVVVGFGNRVASAAAKSTVLVSVNGGGGPAGGGDPALSGNGRYVAFSSWATNLDSRCGQVGVDAIYVRDLVARTTECVSLDNAGLQPRAYGFDPHVSDDGRYVEYWAESQGSDPQDPATGVFVRDRVRGITIRANVDNAGATIGAACTPAAMSADGTTVAFYAAGSFAFYVRDLVHGTTRKLQNANYRQCGESSVALNRTGRFIAFNGSADSGQNGLVVYDRTSGKRRFVRSGADLPSLSADGSVLAYETKTALDAGDTNGAQDVYVLDRGTGATSRVSVSTAGTMGNAASYYPQLSPNGRFVAFLSVASNLVPADTNGCDDVFVHDRISGTTFRTNRTSTGGQATGGISTVGGEQIGITTTADNQTLVAFTSSAPLVPADHNDSGDDVYLRGP